MRVRKRVTLMVITVSAIFAVCWLAECIDFILGVTISALIFGDATLAIVNTLIIFNSTINPIVYALINQRFREKMKLMIGRCCRPVTHLSRGHQSMQVVNSTTHPTLETEESSKE